MARSVLDSVEKMLHAPTAQPDTFERVESALLCLRSQTSAQREALIKSLPTRTTLAASLVEALGFVLVADPCDAVKKAAFEKLFVEATQIQNPSAQFHLLRCAILARGGVASKEPMMNLFLERFGDQAKSTLNELAPLAKTIAPSLEDAAKLKLLACRLMATSAALKEILLLPPAFRWQCAHIKLALQRAGFEHLESVPLPAEQRTQFLMQLMPEEIRPFQFILIRLIIACGDQTVFGLLAERFLREHSTKHADILRQDRLSSLESLTF